MAKNIREKAAKNKLNKDNRPKAYVKGIRISSSKIVPVLNLIRNKSYNEAVSILENTPKSASEVILKLLNSAASNAENNLSINKDKLFVAECYAGQGSTYKRLMIRARGRADRRLSRTSHITIILDEVREEK